MNREIKFRAWDTRFEEMYYPNEENEFEVEHRSDFDYSDLLSPSYADELLPLQYIGHTDIRGHEIYEGDIVRYDHEDGLIIAQVVHKQSDDESMRICGFEYKLIRTEDYPEGMEYDAFELEIIGNIYENPELLHP